MDTELKSLDLPCNVDDFCKIQVKRFSSHTQKRDDRRTISCTYLVHAVGTKLLVGWIEREYCPHPVRRVAPGRWCFIYTCIGSYRRCQHGGAE